MTQKDQPDWREIADELATALLDLACSPLREAYLNASEITDAEAALRRYDEASKLWMVSGLGATEREDELSQRVEMLEKEIICLRGEGASLRKKQRAALEVYRRYGPGRRLR